MFAECSPMWMLHRVYEVFAAGLCISLRKDSIRILSHEVVTSLTSCSLWVRS